MNGERTKKEDNSSPSPSTLGRFDELSPIEVKHPRKHQEQEEKDEESDQEVEIEEQNEGDEMIQNEDIKDEKDELNNWRNPFPALDPQANHPMKHDEWQYMPPTSSGYPEHTPLEYPPMFPHHQAHPYAAAPWNAGGARNDYGNLRNDYGNPRNDYGNPRNDYGNPRNDYGNPYLMNRYYGGGPHIDHYGWIPGGGGYFPPGPPRSVCSALSRESSRDDLTSMGGEGQIFEYEDRFRVDRRKLELLIMGRFDPVKETAYDFFNRIGEETNSTVIWPSRLKIGAKSKKDPHIRVGGTEETVRMAKGRIMEYLDTRSNRVTMKMDVSYTDHSHVIGKGGNTIRRVMAETNCHIHFPDSNRSNPNEKSNQVSIAGEIDGVETARSRIRELTPLIFCFDLPIIPSLQSIPDNSDPYLKAIQDQYNIQITFRQKQKNFHTTMVVIKGCECEAARVKEATLLLMEHLCGNIQFNNYNNHLGSTGYPSGNKNSYMNSVDGMKDNDFMSSGYGNGGMNPMLPGGGNQVVAMNMEISPQHHQIVLGKGNITLKLIMQRTNTTILFPDAADPNIPSIRKGSVTITGSIHNVYLARQQLIGSLPLVLMFDITDDSEFEEEFVQKLQTDLDVAISIKPKARQSNKSVIIKAQERNADSIYKARAALLGIDEDITTATIPETYNIRAVSSTTGLTLPMNHRAFHNVPSPTSSGPPMSLPTFALNNMMSVGPKSPYMRSSAGSYHGGSAPQTPIPESPRPPGFDCAVSPRLPRPVHPFSGLLAPPPGTPLPTPNHMSPNPNNHHLPPNPPPTAFPWVPPGHPGNQYTNALPPNHPFLQDYAMLVLSNITRLQQQQQQLQEQNNLQIYERQQNLRRHSASSTGAISSINAAPLTPTNYNEQKDFLHPKMNHNNNVLSGPGLNSLCSPPIPGTSPRNSSPVRADGNVTNNFAKLELHDQSCSTSGAEKSSGSGIESNNNNNNSLTCVNKNNKENFGFLGDRRAPGCEKEIYLKSQDEYSDYDQKKLLASKAMRQKVAGEVRIPNPTWSGLGFSSSMPESVIKQKLKEEEERNNLSGENNNRRRMSKLSSSGSTNERQESIPEEESPPKVSERYEKHQPQASSSSAYQRFLFGNSSAYDTILNHESTWIKPNDDLPSVFAKQGLAKYTDLFLRQEIDLRTFSSLTDEDLKEIGIQTFGARKKLLLLANKTKQALDHQTWVN